MEQLPICISTRLRRAARQASRLYDDALEAVGLSVAQYSMLRAIERLDTPTINDLAHTTQLDPSTLGRNMKVLERAGLITQAPGQDRRTRCVTLSATGKERLLDAAELWAGVQDTWERRLGAGGRDELFDLLQVFEGTANPAAR